MNKLKLKTLKLYIWLSTGNQLRDSVTWALNSSPWNHKWPILQYPARTAAHGLADFQHEHRPGHGNSVMGVMQINLNIISKVGLEATLPPLPNQSTQYPPQGTGCADRIGVGDQGYGSRSCETNDISN